MKAFLSFFVLMTLWVPAKASAPRDTVVSERVYTREFLDTVNLKRRFIMNDYTSVGVQWGYSLSRMTFNPPRNGQTLLPSPKNFGITYTRYCKMFGYMPYFGFQAGLFYGQDGFRTKSAADEETGSRYNIEGIYETVYDYVEVPMLALFHVDSGIFRIEANLGPYGAYRLSVSRSGDETLADEFKDSFRDYDRRIDYGIRGGLGVAFLFDPVEFHIGGQVRYGFSSTCKPDYYSEYYYRYAQPFDIIISAGVQFQLTKRSGKTRAFLRREAMEIVKGESEK